MFFAKVRLEFISPGEDGVTKFTRHGDVTMFLLNMTGHIPPPRPLKPTLLAPPPLPTCLGLELLQLFSDHVIQGTLPG